VVQGFLVAENMASCACRMQQNGEKTFFSVFFCSASALKNKVLCSFFLLFFVL